MRTLNLAATVPAAAIMSLVEGEDQSKDTDSIIQKKKYENQLSFRVEAMIRLLYVRQKDIFG